MKHSRKNNIGFTLIETLVASTTAVITVSLASYLLINSLNWQNTFSERVNHEANLNSLVSHLRRIHSRAESIAFFQQGAAQAGFQIFGQGAVEIRADLRPDFRPVNGADPTNLSTIRIVCCEPNIVINNNRSHCSARSGLSIQVTAPAGGGNDLETCYEGIENLRLVELTADPSVGSSIYRYLFGKTMSLPRALGQPRSSGVEFHEAYFSLGYWLNGGQRPRFIIHQIPTFTILN